jgi:hypothetical protein
MKTIETTENKPQMSVLQALLNFFGPGFMEDFKRGWNEAANKPVSVCETDDEEEDDGVLVPNALLEGTSYDNFSNPEIELNPYGFTKIN